MKTQIEIVWSVNDLRLLGYECTDEQGMEILEWIKRNHDANYGVTWYTIEYACEEFNLSKNENTN